MALPQFGPASMLYDSEPVLITEESFSESHIPAAPQIRKDFSETWIYLSNST